MTIEYIETDAPSRAGYTPIMAVTSDGIRHHIGAIIDSGPSKSIAIISGCLQRHCGSHQAAVESVSEYLNTHTQALDFLAG